MTLTARELAVLKTPLGPQYYDRLEHFVAKLRGFGIQGRGPVSGGRGIEVGSIMPSITYNSEDSTSQFVESGVYDWPLVRDQGEIWAPASLSYVDLFDNTIENTTGGDAIFRFRGHIYSGSAGNTVQSRLLVDGTEEYYEQDTSNHNVVWGWTISAGATVRVQVQAKDSDESGAAGIYAYDGSSTSPPQTPDGPAVWLAY